MQIRAEQLLNNEQMLQAQMQMLLEKMGLVSRWHRLHLPRWVAVVT